MTHRFFITGTGTGVGKTLLTCALAHQLRLAQRKVMALKPVISGYSSEDVHSDTAEIIASLGHEVDAAWVDKISPWRFAEPSAPSMAAAAEGKTMVLEEILQFCRAVHWQSDTLLIEGAGGVMSPLSDRHTMLDWIAAMECPAILVAGNYLGAISHTLTAAESLRMRGVFLQAVVISESSPPGIALERLRDECARFMPYARHVVTLPRVAGRAPLWQNVHDLTGLLV